MRLIDPTRMSANYSMGLNPGSRDHPILAIESTFVPPNPGEQVCLADGPICIDISAPKHFSELPASDDPAFGGADERNDNEARHDTCLPNPAGCGWHKRLKNAWVGCARLPNTVPNGEAEVCPAGSASQ